MMVIPDFDQYLDYRRNFSVSRELVDRTLAWAKPLARQALGAHALRDNLGLGDSLQLVPAMTSGATNGGWGELMPVWFKPYERPLPIFVLDNWAMTALLCQYWMGEVGPHFTVGNLLKIFVGGDLLIPYLPEVQGGGRFLRHGALAMLLAVLWLEPEARGAFIAHCRAGARRFDESYLLGQREDISDYMAQLEFEALFLAEGSKIGGAEKIRAFLANGTQFNTYAALFGGLCFSLTALYDWYGPEWESWVFQKINLDYRLAHFGLQAWANWLGIEYVEPAQDVEISKLFTKDHGQPPRG